MNNSKRYNEVPVTCMSCGKIIAMSVGYNIECLSVTERFINDNEIAENERSKKIKRAKDSKYKPWQKTVMLLCPQCYCVAPHSEMLALDNA